MAKKSPPKKTRSPELTGGSGHTYEDAVVGHFLVALLLEQGAAPLAGAVKRVAVQQGAVGEPLDDIVVDAENEAGQCRFSAQVKSSLTISAAESNEEFRDVIVHSLETRAKSNFRVGVDRYGFVAGSVGDERLTSLTRITTRARASATATDFWARFEGIEFSNADRALREELGTLIGAKGAEEEWDFYRHFAALRMDGLEPGGGGFEELRSRAAFLAEDVAVAPGLLEIILQRVRQGEGAAAVWSRPSAIADLRAVVRLKISPSYASDMAILAELAGNYLAEIPQSIGGVAIERKALLDQARETCAKHRLTNISGLPGCGKSVVLCGLIEEARARGPVLFLKSDRLDANSWRAYASKHGLNHLSPVESLAEVGGSGEATLFVDGLDRIKPEHRGVVTDLLTAISSVPALARWRLVASSRDQGLEPLREWVPSSFYKSTGVGDVSVGLLDDNEAEQLAAAIPHLRRLLFAGGPVQEIARRPFFASVLDRQFAGQSTEGAALPQTESELIAAWWKAGGYNAEAAKITLRQRALIDIAAAGSSSLGKAVRLKHLKEATVEQIAGLRQDGILDVVEEGSVVSFSHDIYFEWAFLRLLVDEGEAWPDAIVSAGEPPLLARVVSLLSQQTFEHGGLWASTLENLANPALRPQWRRAWILGPPGSQKFSENLAPFEASLFADDFALFEKFLVWFQAERTIPNPVILQNGRGQLDSDALVRVADSLGWPSDVDLWIRVITWILERQNRIPARLIPSSVEVLRVFQNMFADYRNAVSRRILEQSEAWLLDIAVPRVRRGRVSDPPSRWDELDEDSTSAVGDALRGMILRSARGYPEQARRLIERTCALDRPPEELFKSIVMMAPFAAQTCGEQLADLTRALLIRELPKDEMERHEREAEEHRQTRAAIRAKPEAEWSERERHIISNVFHRMGMETYDFDDIGVERHSSVYFPPSPRHQPFAALFDVDPDRARQLVRDIVNHATLGWRQIFEINAPRYGTPLPVTIQFPWGAQVFWGGQRTYNWYLGELAPHPVEAALLALTYWAHKRIDKGDAVDDVIRDVVEGHNNMAVLGLAASLACQRGHVSETTLALMRSQRLWLLDMHRQVQDPGRPLNLLGINPLNQLTPEQREASTYLQGRTFRKISLKDLSSRFVLLGSPEMQTKFKDALAQFPNDLPYEYEEQIGKPGYEDDVKRAKIWSGWGNPDNYKETEHPEDAAARVVSFVPPEPEPEERAEARKANEKVLAEFHVQHVTQKALEDAGTASDLRFPELIAFMRDRDAPDLFDVVAQPGSRTSQTAMASLAAATVVYSKDPEELKWAWSVLERIKSIEPRPEGERYGKNPYDPRMFLMAVYSRVGPDGRPYVGAGSYLIGIAACEEDELSKTALAAMLRLHADPRLPRIAGQLASELFVWPAADYSLQGDRSFERLRSHREAAKKRALDLLGSSDTARFVSPPQAWVKEGGRARGKRRQSTEGEDWKYPDHDFQPQWAAQLLHYFPVENWMVEADTREALLIYTDELVKWTTERVFPVWAEKRDSRDRIHEMYAWFSALAQQVGRIAGYIPAKEIIERFLHPFSRQEDEAAISFLGAFTWNYVCRHVYDAKELREDVVPMVEYLLDRMLTDRDFDIKRYRAGEIYTHGIKDMINSLLLVLPENAPAATRFANGDYAEVGLFLPLIGKFMGEAGWHPSVIRDYLTLCERAGRAITIQSFFAAVTSALDQVSLKPHLWRGTTIHARIAGVVQRLGESNHPLGDRDARALLVILDRLVDLGDRRAAALQQSEYFRNVRVIGTGGVG